MKRVFIMICEFAEEEFGQDREDFDCFDKKLSKAIVRKYLKSLPLKVDRAILFGSTARGDRLKDSDVDLIVISEDFREMDLPHRFLVLQLEAPHRFRSLPELPGRIR